MSIDWMKAVSTLNVKHVSRNLGIQTPKFLFPKTIPNPKSPQHNPSCMYVCTTKAMNLSLQILMQQDIGTKR